MSLQGCWALVTGASRGIGRAVALRLARQGAHLVVHYAQQRGAAEEVARCCGGESFALGADLRTTAGVEALADELRGRLSELRVIVHNAGLAETVSFSETTEAQLDEMLAIHLKAPFFLTQKLLPLLSSGSRVVHISSQTARLAYPSQLAYTLGKGALETLTLQLAALLGERGITVNAVAPGTIATDMSPELKDPQGREEVLWQQALGRAGEPDDVAGAVAFLVGPDAGWITGQVLTVSGGACL